MNRHVGQPTVSPTRPPEIADHELFCPIASGSYGEVWFARNIVGTLRAVKIVRRDQHASTESFDREFKGLQKFEPVSRAHEGLADILTLGRLPDGAGFYYVMELADDAKRQGSDGVMESWSDAMKSGTRHSTTPSLHYPNSYTARTLRQDLKQHGHLPVADCLQLGLKLTAALAHLHAQGLVHRDVKPSNILFIGGEPKLADAGLVAAVNDARSLVGTAGYIAPEGPGTPQADLYALGKVLYEAAFGKDRQDFPQLPPDLRTRPDHARLLELNAVLLRACATNPRERYACAKAMFADLELLHVGKSVQQRRKLERGMAWARKAAVGIILAGLAAAVLFVVKNSVARRTAKIKSSGDLFETSGTQNREAYNYYRLGAFYQRSNELNAGPNAVACFEKAIKADPKFARAYAGLAECYWSMAGNELPSRPTQEKERDAVLKALALDDSLPEAHCILALWKRSFEWDWTGAEREFKRALELDPNSAMTHQHYAEFLSGMNRHDEAIREAERAVAADPTLAATRDCHGWALYCAHQFERAIEVYRESAEQDPHYAITFFSLREVYSRMGRFDEAAAAYLHAIEVLDAGRNLPRAQRTREANQQGGWLGIQRLKISHLLAAPPDNRDGHLIASTYLRLGDKDAAMDWLERAADDRSSRVSSIGGDPTFDPLRSEPRFQALLRKMGLEK